MRNKGHPPYDRFLVFHKLTKGNIGWTIVIPCSRARLPQGIPPRKKSMLTSNLLEYELKPVSEVPGNFKNKAGYSRQDIKEILETFIEEDYPCMEVVINTSDLDVNNFRRMFQQLIEKRGERISVIKRKDRIFLVQNRTYEYDNCDEK